MDERGQPANPTDFASWAMDHEGFIAISCLGLTLPVKRQVCVGWLTSEMATPIPIRVTFARLCRDTRLMLDITQQELAEAVGVSRPYIASIELGRANPSLDVVERIARTLGLELDLVGRPPIVFNAPRQRDLVHARCTGYVERRLIGLGWQTRREVTIIRGRSRGWIDILAFDPRRRILLVVEIKTWLDDLGAIERQLDWYLCEAPSWRETSDFDQSGPSAGSFSWPRPRPMTRSARTATPSTAGFPQGHTPCVARSPGNRVMR
jgi:putative transcriptional regulator